jgi:hypothetical protein
VRIGTPKGDTGTSIVGVRQFMTVVEGLAGETAWPVQKGVVNLNP